MNWQMIAEAIELFKVAPSFRSLDRVHRVIRPLNVDSWSTLMRVMDQIIGRMPS